ncbi:MAG: phosphoglycerate kinase [Pseudomonadota bacterium]
MTEILRMTDLDLTDRRVLIREDLNVPVAKGQVTSDARIRAALPTIELALSKGARVLVMSHLGRPTEGHADPSFSLAPVVDRMGELLSAPVTLCTDYLSGLDAKPGVVHVLENVRFNKGEKANDDQLAAALASLCDVFVMDAFGTSHRAQASTHGVAKYADTACAGPLLVNELQALGKALDTPTAPMLAIVGGSKVSTKLTVLKSLLTKVDQLIVGGGIANTFIAAAGFPVGRSLYEEDLMPEAKSLLQTGNIPMPVDVVVAAEFSETATATVKSLEQVLPDELILDIGPETARSYSEIIQAAGTIVWNGPVGVFEFDQFGGGTQAVSQAIAASKGFSIAGGGDTLAAIDKYNIASEVSYISTGGGAFLEFIEGKQLPAVAMLESRAQV